LNTAKTRPHSAVGDQAEILFTLTGEPPFTFTYQRSQLATKKGKPGKVLETHTVTGVTKKEYSIFSALEGTLALVFLDTLVDACFKALGLWHSSLTVTAVILRFSRTRRDHMETPG
jgi:hypothetical protein